MKKRLDKVLTEKGLLDDMKKAFVVVTEGRVFVDGQKAISPAQLVEPNANIEIRDAARYVGRGALKLEAAIKKFEIDVHGKVCADIGAATGGFTEVLLRHGAKKIYTIDTARGKLALKLREDPRVVVMEGVDVRDVKALSEKVDCVTIDVSLIPLREILPHIGRFLSKGAKVIALLKPQYETRDQKILKHGIVENDIEREKLLGDFVLWAEENGWKTIDHVESPLRGSKGNIEYLFVLFQK